MTYFGRWSTYEGMVEDFGESPRDGTTRVPEDMAKPEEVLFASYGGRAYEGDAVVLIRRDGKLYEVHGSHCSCRGLEDRWAPAEVTWDALAMRPVSDQACDFLYDHEPEARAAFLALREARP